jgi:DNA-directed RNA polymerase subunit L
MKVTVLEEQRDGKKLPRNFLRLKIEGKEINYVVLNTLRRLVISLVPSYAFSPDDITIEVNTSIFNNDQMRLRISNMPIVKSVHEVDLQVKDILDIEAVALASNRETRKEFIELQLEQEKRKSELLNNLHMFVSAKNNTSDIMNVTTADAYTQFFLNNKKIDNVYKYPVLIIQLKPGEEFKCICVASKNIHMKHNIFSPCAMVCFDDENSEFYLESYGQFSEKDILVMACNIFLTKLDNLKTKLLNLVDPAVDDVEITIENENYTMGHIMTHYLQNHEDVQFCGFNVDSPFEYKVVIRCKTHKNTVVQVIGDSTDKLNKLFKSLINELQKI